MRRIPHDRKSENEGVGKGIVVRSGCLKRSVSLNLGVTIVYRGIELLKHATTEEI